MSPRAALGICAIGILLGSPAGGQARNPIVAEADAAFAAGNVALADSLYYIAVRHRPREPEARAALGRYLAAQGRAKVAVVLLEEARMFGGPPAEIARQLVPLYVFLGEWRALLTLPGSPLTGAERRRAAWLSERGGGGSTDGGAAPLVGAPRGDTIARVATRIGGKATVASIVGADVGYIVGGRIAAGAARHFEGDSTVVAFDSITIGRTRLTNVPATIGAPGSTLTVGVAALGRLVLQVDYRRSRMVLSPTDAGAVESRNLLVRTGGQLSVLDRGRWVSLGDYAATVAKAAKTLVIDVAGGEVRVRP